MTLYETLKGFEAGGRRAAKTYIPRASYAPAYSVTANYPLIKLGKENHRGSKKTIAIRWPLGLRPALLGTGSVAWPAPGGARRGKSGLGDGLSGTGQGWGQVEYQPEGRVRQVRRIRGPEGGDAGQVRGEFDIFEPGGSR